MSVGMNILALLSPDVRGISSGGAAVNSTKATDSGPGSFSELLDEAFDEKLEALLGELSDSEKEALLAGVAELALAADGKELPPGMDSVLQADGEAADLLATLVPEWQQWLTDTVQVGDDGQFADAQFSLVQVMRQQVNDAAAMERGLDGLRPGNEPDKRALSMDDFAALRQKLGVEANGSQNSTLRPVDVLRAETAARRSGGEEVAESVRLAQPGSAAAAAALTARPVTAASQTFGVPFGQSGWSEAVVDKVMWMSSNNLSSVEIRLTPAELGPLEIHLQNRGQELQVQFVSQNPSVREALESQVFRLREMLGQQGLDVLDVSVGDSGVDQQQQSAERGQSESFSASGAADSGEEGPVLTSTVLPVAANSDRLVDYYA